MKNQRVKYFLRKWGYFDQNFNYLSTAESIQMKILYLALKELSPEERQFLAEKYRVTRKPITDATLAAKHGLDFKEYREKRIALENKFNPILKKYDDIYHPEVLKAIRLESK